MFTIVTCLFAGYLASAGAQQPNIPNWYTALVPVNIKCTTDPVKGLVCAAEYADSCKEQWNFPNPCTIENRNMNVTKFVHPLDKTKFLMCGDLGKLYVVRCPQYEVFHEGCDQCVGEGSGFDASCEIPLTPMIKNPCTKESILANKLFFAFPGNLNKFIHCDVWGKAWERTCTTDQVWSQYDVACVPPMSVNPCSRPDADMKMFYQHPCNPYKFLRCDVHGVAYEVTCPDATAFIDASQSCQPLNSLSYQPEVYCRHHIFNFRIYNAALELGAPKGVPQSDIGSIGAATRTSSQTVTRVNSSPIVKQQPQSAMNLGMTSELRAIMNAWKSNVNGSPDKLGLQAGDRLAMSRNFVDVIKQQGSADLATGTGNLKLSTVDIASTTGGLKNDGTALASGSGSFNVISGPTMNTIRRNINTVGSVGGMSRAPDGTVASVADITGSLNSMSGAGAHLMATGQNVPTTNVQHISGGSVIANGLVGTIRDAPSVSNIGLAAATDAFTEQVNPTDAFGASTMHPTQLEEYTFSDIRWAAPCTQDNIQNGRFHFKLMGDPHSYIQCDAHGNMFKMPCSKDATSTGWFDVYTSTCVDGPIHVPEERLSKFNSLNTPFNTIFFEPIPSKDVTPV